MDWPGLWVSAVRGIVYLERQAISGHHEQCFFSYLCPCRERSQSAGGGVVPKSHLALATPMVCVPSSSSVDGISQGKRQKQEIKGNKTSKDRRLWIASLKQLRPTWLHIPGCLVLGEWSHHCDYLGHEDPSCTVLLCILPPLLNIFCLCF